VGSVQLEIVSWASDFQTLFENEDGTLRSPMHCYITWKMAFWASFSALFARVHKIVWTDRPAILLVSYIGPQDLVDSRWLPSNIVSKLPLCLALKMMHDRLIVRHGNRVIPSVHRMTLKHA
jgi:hypothetical protein